jgi:putative DNA methylase
MTSKGWHSRGYLPHFDAKGVVQHIVLHTRAALPVAILAEMANLEARERHRLLDAALDASLSGKVFGDARCALALEAQLLHFDGLRYDLLAWCIMPNHVHVVMCCLGQTSVGQIVRTWKVQSTAAINMIQGTKGPVFAADYFDRYMRDGQQTERTIAYVENNPVTAALCVHPADWRPSSAHHRAKNWHPRTENLPLSLY